MAPYRIGNDKAVRILGDPLLPDAMTGSARPAYHRNFVDKGPLKHQGLSEARISNPRSLRPSVRSQAEEPVSSS